MSVWGKFWIQTKTGAILLKLLSMSKFGNIFPFFPRRAVEVTLVGVSPPWSQTFSQGHCFESSGLRVGSKHADFGSDSNLSLQPCLDQG